MDAVADFQYVKGDLDSWHILGTFTRVPGRVLTVCELSTGSPESPAAVRDEYPSHEKTCENCFRRVAK